MVNEQINEERERSKEELVNSEQILPQSPSIHAPVKKTIRRHTNLKKDSASIIEELKNISAPVAKKNDDKISKKGNVSAKQLPSENLQPQDKLSATGNRKSKVADKPVEKKATKKTPRIKAIVHANVLKITFQIRFKTEYGQQLLVTGNHELLGNNDTTKALSLLYTSDDVWKGAITIQHTAETIVYKYILRDKNGVSTVEWGDDKIIHPSQINSGELLLADIWNYPGYYENTFYTEPFKEVLFKQNFTSVDRPQPGSYTHTFKVKAPLLTHNQVLCVCGNVPELGGWSMPGEFIMNHRQGDDWWTFSVDLSNAHFPVAYKYGVYNIASNSLLQFEEGSNRVLPEAPVEKAQTIITECFIKLPNNTFKGAGVAIPVFSLRSKSNLGIGEFNDLKLLADWSKKAGLKLIQVLPVNDTTATHTISDSYPYAAISAFALHPAYLHLPAVIGNKDKALLQELGDLRLTFADSKEVEYSGVVNAKFDFIKKIFPSRKNKTFKSGDFKTFFQTNIHWLIPYAAFCYFRDQYGDADFTRWPSNNTYDATEINALASDPLKAKDDLSIHFFIQYHLHLQLKAATNYAHENGIIIKGDIPIGIYRNSCDAWQQPELYNMDQQAGAPPDDFAVKGQNWGFPTYNWQKMAEDGFSWWKKRFEQMSYYFDAFRIDHILGFFRIWSIPMHAVEGIMGRFVPAQPVHINEFYENDIWFDLNRYTRPFINDNILENLFGHNKDYVLKNFLQSIDGGYYELLPAYDTQRKVEAHFSEITDNSNRVIRQGLFNLIANVILFDQAGSGGQQFHFRIGMENTSSYHNLEENTKQKLKNLYINYFFRRQDDFWMKEAMAKLPELKQSTNMLIFGEDLGMVPACVPGVMKNLSILSLEIQRMPKDPQREFFHPHDAPYLSVVTPSTHDMSTIRGWWEEDQQTTQRFYNRELGQYGKAPLVCEAWINEKIVLQHLNSSAMWSIFQLQDLLGISDELRRVDPVEERINIPSNEKHFWVYKMHLNLEDLLKHDNYTTRLKEYVSAAGR